MSQSLGGQTEKASRPASRLAPNVFRHIRAQSGHGSREHAGVIDENGIGHGIDGRKKISESGDDHGPLPPRNATPFDENHQNENIFESVLGEVGCLAAKVGKDIRDVHVT
jgi:hypothetical protein